jgi:hypothetical protein
MREPMCWTRVVADPMGSEHLRDAVARLDRMLSDVRDSLIRVAVVAIESVPAAVLKQE